MSMTNDQKALIMFVAIIIVAIVVFAKLIPWALQVQSSHEDRLSDKLDRKYGTPVATVSNSKQSVDRFTLHRCTVNASGDAEFISGVTYRDSIWTIYVPEDRNWKAKDLCDLLNGKRPTEEELDRILGPRKSIGIDTRLASTKYFRTCVIGKGGEVTLSTDGRDVHTFTDAGTIKAPLGFCKLLPGATADIEIYPKGTN